MASGGHHGNAAGTQLGSAKAEGFVSTAGVDHSHRHRGHRRESIKAAAAMEQHTIAIATGLQQLTAMALIRGERALGSTLSIKIGTTENQQTGLGTGLGDGAPLADQSVKSLEGSQGAHVGQIKRGSGLLQRPGPTDLERHSHRVGNDYGGSCQAAMAEMIELCSTHQNPAAQPRQGFGASLLVTT